MEEVGVAAKMGMAPSAFWNMTESDQAYLLAFFRVQGTMESFEHIQQEKKAAQQSKGKKR